MPDEIKTIFDQYGGVMRTGELREYGFSDRKIKKMIADGLVENIRRGYYQYVGDGSFTESAIIARLFPDGVLCMESALDYYEYTDRTPSAWHIAVDSRTSKERFRIAYPIVKPHYTESHRFTVGIADGEVDGVALRVYDRERTICDCLRNRNKMDAEVFNDAVKNYLKDPNRNISRLAKYSFTLHVDKKVREVIGIWL